MQQRMHLAKASKQAATTTPLHFNATKLLPFKVLQVIQLLIA
jgi:hypothetical protein